MRLYRKVIPRIAHDAIKALATKKFIEVEQDRMEEAELDLAAVMVAYLNAEEAVLKETHETMARRGLSADRFAQMKKSVADLRKIKLGEEGLDYVLSQMIEALFASKNIAEIYGEDREIRLATREIMDRYLSISEEVDKEARDRIKNIREGTPEWDIEYPRIVSMLKRQKGLE